VGLSAGESCRGCGQNPTSEVARGGKSCWIVRERAASEVGLKKPNKAKLGDLGEGLDMVWAGFFCQRRSRLAYKAIRSVCSGRQSVPSNPNHGVAPECANWHHEPFWALTSVES
jgi:hypothetical protein